ncbi:MAG TPA: PAS domain S-box protein [Pyrinomonadaceae bacterium]|nr:PAS domain S-box protein [Pyrinomonadaceae bacterium]
MSRKVTPTKKAVPGGNGAAAAPDVDRAWLAAIVESSEDAILSKTLEGTVTSWNAAAERLYGYTAEEAVGRHVSFIVPEGLHGQLANIHERLGRGEKISDLETVRVRKDGARVEVSVSISPVRDAAGRIVGAATIARDIGRRRRAEAERARLAAQVEDERRRLQDLVSSVPGVVWEAWGEPDESGQRIDFVSDYVEQMLGYTKEEWLRTPNFWLTIVHPEDRERAASEARAKFKGSGGVSEFRWVRKDGRVVHVASHSVPVRDAEGRAAGMRGVTMDITARKEAEEALGELLREHEQTIEEVSTPVVPVLEGVLVLPLIGSLDPERTSRATRAALTEVTRQGARVCIIDITGARIVDSAAVANLTNLVHALKLVGAEGCVTGVGAQAARTLVGLGLDMTGLRTYRTLAQALAALTGAGGRR